MARSTRTLIRPARTRVDQSGVEVDTTQNDPASGVTTGETVTLGRQPGEPATPETPPAPPAPAAE